MQRFKVDTSKIVDNHIEKVLPLADEQEIRDTFKSTLAKVEEISTLLKNTKGTKPNLVDNMTQADIMVNKLIEDLWVGLFKEVE